jgi:surfeit locus 1 family protein
LNNPDESPEQRAGAAARPVTFTPAGIAGSIVLAAVIVLFLRLGFWQLDRRVERVTSNADVAARLEQPPIDAISQLADTTGLTYRIAVARGRFDNARYIVLPGRSNRGMPGVHLLVPLLLEGRSDALLVNRGWIPSPDASTINASDFDVADTVDVSGLVLPFPGAEQSLAQRGSAENPPGRFRHVWYSIDEAALRAQFPYPLLNALLQDRGPAVAGARYPLKLEPPALDEGPHLGYALQWFAFAAIGVIGWFALMLRARSSARAALPLLVLAPLFGGAAPAAAQLRPLDPLEWRIFEDDVVFIGGAGFGVMLEQPAPLAGTRGTLLEAGSYVLSYRSGRIAVEVGGTALWRLSDQEQVEPPAPEVEPADGSRQDAGPAYASSALRFSPDSWPVDLVLRFGGTIPTTSDESGLDRDRIDFFALLGARYRTGPLMLVAENGVGIHGTLRHDLPQSDVWTYAFGAFYDVRGLRVGTELVGRQDGHSYIIRGNEDQRELRAGLHVGRRHWLRVQYIRGLSDFSPSHGVRLSGGVLLRRD